MSTVTAVATIIIVILEYWTVRHGNRHEDLGR